jgi:hypothetical protein
MFRLQYKIRKTLKTKTHMEKDNQQKPLIFEISDFKAVIIKMLQK